MKQKRRFRFLYIFLLLLVVVPLISGSRGDLNILEKCGIFPKPETTECDSSFDYDAVVKITGFLQDGAHSIGSGVIIDQTGIIVTASHVVDNCGTILVTIGGTHSYIAETVTDYPEKDISILEIVKMAIIKDGLVTTKPLTENSTFPFVPFQPNSCLFKGDVQVVGFPAANPKLFAGTAITPDVIEEYFEENIKKYRKTGELDSWFRDKVYFLLLQGQVNAGCQFININEDITPKGASGGAIIHDGKVVGIVSRYWPIVVDGKNTAIIVAVPIPSQLSK